VLDARKKTNPDERGAIAIIVALTLMTLIGFAALAMDIGRFRVAASELQSASDSGALAGAWQLNAAADGEMAARTYGSDFAEKHTADYEAGQPKPIDDVDPNTDVKTGNWDFASRVFEEGGALEDMNAVEVTTYRHADKGTAMPGWLGGLMGYNQANEVRRAVAVGLGPGCLNGFPLTIPECAMLNPDGSPKCDGTEIKLSNDIVDNGGLTSLNTENAASVNYVRNLIEGYGASKECNTSVDDDIKVMNGNPKQPVGQTIRDVLLDPDGDGVEEQVLVYLPIIDTPCPVKFNQIHHVTGYIGFWLQHVNLPNDPGGDPATDPFVTGVLECSGPPVGQAGGKWYGTKGKPRLVY